MLVLLCLTPPSRWEKQCQTWTYTVVDALRQYGGVDVSHDGVTMPLAPYQALFDALFFSHKAPVILSSSVTRPEAIEVSMARASIPQSIIDALNQFSTSSASVLPATTAERDAFYRVRSSLIEKAWEASFESGIVSAPEDAFACLPVSTVTRIPSTPIALILTSYQGDTRKRTAQIQSCWHTSLLQRSKLCSNIVSATPQST